MIRKVIEYFKQGGPVGYLIAGIIYICAFVARFIITVYAGILLGLGLTFWTNNSQIIIWVLTICVALSFLVSYSISLEGPLGFLSLDALTKDPKEAASRVKKAEKYGDLPHFDKLLKKDQVMNIISNSSFAPYRTKSGKVLEHVTASEDDKWLCILDGYMPVDLICGYNRKKNELYTIDGGVIGLPFKSRFFHISDEIEEFFKDRGVYYTEMPRKASEKFDASFQRPVDMLDKADFSRLRYQWEKANSSDKSGYLKNQARGQKYNPVLEKRVPNDAIFNRVLTDVEIAKTADAIRKKQVALSEFIQFERYSNEFCVCNGVEFLNNLRYPANADGMNFLFKCLRDVDEAYFGLAVDALMDYPKGPVERKIEEDVKSAFENHDVVGLAGVMFLAKEIGYEIKYVEEIKKAQAEAAENGSKSDSDSIDVIPEFNFDELAAFGSKEVQGFSPGVVAYKEQ